jgi:hypothetical protein
MIVQLYQEHLTPKKQNTITDYHVHMNIFTECSDLLFEM